MTSRREHKAALRAERSGAGPVRTEGPPPRFPGASGRFALFGEVLQTGLLMTLVALPVITLPAALAAGIRHLRRHVAAEDSRLQFFWADVRRAVLPGAVVGAVALVATLVLLLDIDLARSGFLPGGAVIEIVGWVGLAVVSVALLACAGAWTPALGWRGALRCVPAAIAADPAGALYLAATAVFVVVSTWALVPLFIPAIGCAALAVVAIPTRRRGRA
ncbi:hypothetical protein NQ156_04080 [Microbacterium sp. zg.Y625]|uniref:hypothetical protein n=1 Tax=Microbacterium jiangjiandongii TaxID=3049071 RepID=UPI00214B044B|nr:MULTISPECIES: hypothetical protein [unclassified Microbacterium]MCR2792236.1 hypothetical protein [Microbacterium sp. zg.Y625]MCR2815036.1 hypothetical protein [Microbacterium sp. zg.Y843]WIM25037.1 hypothetical protein QNO14_12990 [Microbacterium sp. zg-Y625]